MDPGRLRHRVTIRQRTAGQDAAGRGVEDVEDEHRASAERVLPDGPDCRGSGVAREDHRVRETRGAPEWLVERQRRLLVAPEPEPKVEPVAADPAPAVKSPVVVAMGGVA